MRWVGAEHELTPVGTGSHIDAIPQAGMYDGTVGVLGGLEAMRALRESGFQPRRSIELLLLTSEEPTRFGIGCLGSRLLSGVLSPERAKSYYHAWVELHIEQGPLLERGRVPIGMVTSIAAPAGYRFTIDGFGGHAGALLMPDRRDALCAAAELILSIERHTLAANQASGGADTVATVGALEISPGNVNSVPGRVVLQLDIRDIDPMRREGVMRAVRAEIKEVQQRRGVTIREECVNADAPTTCSTEIVATIAQVCAERGIAPQGMVSRAYHDSSFIALIAPVAMIFIPCRAGVSHKPDEFAAPEDIARGAAILAETLARLAME